MDQRAYGATMAVSSLPHVVILDESPVLATAFGRVFVDADYRVTALADCAITPAEVLALRPHLIVVDLQCGYSRRGLDLVRGLRAKPTGRDVPVIASPTLTWCDQPGYLAD